MNQLLENPEPNRAQRRKYVDKKIIVRLRIFTAIFLIMVGIGVYDTIHGDLSLGLTLAALLGGLTIGLLVGRSSSVVWNEEAGKAITKMDVFGGVILVAYIVFAIFRNNIVSHWLTGPALSAFVMWLSGSIMLGRLITLRASILKVLRNQGL